MGKAIPFPAQWLRFFHGIVSKRTSSQRSYPMTWDQIMNGGERMGFRNPASDVLNDDENAVTREWGQGQAWPAWKEAIRVIPSCCPDV